MLQRINICFQLQSILQIKKAFRQQCKFTSVGSCIEPATVVLLDYLLDFEGEKTEKQPNNPETYLIIL